MKAELVKSLDRLSVFMSKNIRNLIEKENNFPASIHNYHGGWKGGLLEHTILVTDLVVDKLVRLGKPSLMFNGVRSALLHDLGKMIVYGKKFPSVKNKCKKSLALRLKKFGANGFDKHISATFYLIDEAGINVEDKVEEAILFHHKNYGHIKPTPLGNIVLDVLHEADFKAAKNYKI